MQKSLLFYKVCEGVTAEGNDNVLNIKQILPNANLSWPYRSDHPDIVHSMVYLHTQLEFPSLLDFTLNYEQSLLTIKPSSAYVAVMFRHRSELDSNSYYEAYFNKILSYYLTDDVGSALNFTYLVQLEERYAAIENNVYAYEDVLPVLGDFGQLVPEVWLERLENMLNTLVDPPMTPEFVNVINAHYMDNLAFLSSAYGETDMQMFLGWSVVQYASVYGNLDLVRNFYGTGKRAVSTQREACFDLASRLMGPALFVPFVNLLFPEVVRTDVANMAHDIRNALFGVAAFPNWWHNLDAVLFYLEEAQDRNLKFEYEHMPRMTTNFLDNLQLAVVASRAKRSRTLPRFEEHAEVHGEQKDEITATSALLDAYHGSRFYGIDYLDYSLMPYAVTYPLYQHDVPVGIRYGGLGYQISLATASRYIYSRPPRDYVSVIEKYDDCIRKNLTVSVAYRQNHLVEALSVDIVWSVAQRVKDFGKRRLAKVSGYTDQQLFFITFCLMQCFRQNNWENCDMPLRYNRYFAQAFSCEMDRAIVEKHCSVFS